MSINLPCNHTFCTIEYLLIMLTGDALASDILLSRRRHRNLLTCQDNTGLKLLRCSRPIRGHSSCILKVSNVWWSPSNIGLSTCSQAQVIQSPGTRNSQSFAPYLLNFLFIYFFYYYYFHYFFFFFFLGGGGGGGDFWCCKMISAHCQASKYGNSLLLKHMDE